VGGGLENRGARAALSAVTLADNEAKSGRASPALDQGVSASLDLDQRGMKRPVSFGIPRRPGDEGLDIGAFELQAPPR
jgi:hypothetical protein